MEREVIFGPVTTFDEVVPDKEQALKILEEAAEVFGAWQAWESSNFVDDYFYPIIDECCDVIQAVSNLCNSLGYSDMTTFMDDCKQRNIDRGRISDECQ